MAAHGELYYFGDPNTRRTYAANDNRAWYTNACGHCGATVTSAVIAFVPDGNVQPDSRWLRCPGCGEGSFMSSAGVVYPGPKVGRSVEGLPSNVEQAYDEARRCAEINAFTACEMTCRKILMHIAVDKGANKDNSFKGFVDFLEENHHVTPAMKPWVDVIRKHGNVAVHELPHSDKERAVGTLTFTEQLLRNVYEMEHLAKRFAPAQPGDNGN